jgi:RecB family endonuclease NucS
MKWLSEFLEQANTSNLKTAHYPKEYGTFKMKVSFGQGVSARVPWMSFYADGMSTSNGYYPVYLYFKDAKTLVLSYGVSETNDFGKSWRDDILDGAEQIKNVIENPPRYGDSWIFKAYQIDETGDSFTLTREGNKVEDYELEQDLKEILSKFSANLDDALLQKDSPLSAGLFFMEKQLEDFIIDNWNTSELGKKYDLLYEEGVLISQQYRTSIGPIDILAKDKEAGNYVVIELKRNQTSDDTVGQISRYMGWVSENLGDKSVKGIIIAGKYDEKLHYAQSLIDSIEVQLYEVQFSLKQHKRQA